MEREIRHRCGIAATLRRSAPAWVSSAMIAAATVAIFAAPGVLDPAFNGTGIVRSSFTGGANSVAIDHLGRIIVAGGAEYPNFLIARYNVNGASLDLTFGDSGRVLSQAAGIETVSDVAVDAVGRILVTGSTRADGGDNDFAIARFNTNGALDVTFNGTGYTIVGFGDSEHPSSILIDTLGRIVVAGQSANGFSDFNNDFAILRLEPNGELDTSFDGDGKVLTRFGDWEEINDIAIDALGRIVAVGTIDSENRLRRTKQRIAIARYLDDGRLDATLDGDGKATYSFGRDFSEATSVAIDANGGILVGGFRGEYQHLEGDFSHSYGATADFVLARYHDDGSADLTFGDDGMALTDFGGWDDLAAGIAIDAAGRILLAGSAFTSTTDHDFAVARYGSNGVLDPHFGTDGTTRTAFPDLEDAPSVDRANGIALDSEGRIILAGSSRSVTYDRFVALARYETDRPDFAIDVIPNITVAPGGTGSTTITVNSIDGFELPLQLDLYRTDTGGSLPPGVTSPGVSVTPIPYNSVNATLQVSVSAAVAPATYTLFLFDARFVDHARRVRVNVVSTTQSTASAVDAFTAAGLIHSGVAGALTAKLGAAQSHIDATQTQAAVNTLGAFINQVDAQSGKQIATSATLNGVEFNPAGVLIAQARGVIAYLTIDASPAPLMGYVVTSTQSGVRGATLAIFDASNTELATATTDATGFYFLPATDAWTAGSTYVAKVIGLPTGFTTATPSSQGFTWEGGAAILENFMVNR